MERCYLPPHVFLAIGPRYVVILDLHEDRYSCVLRSRFEQLSTYLHGWPATAHSECSGQNLKPADVTSLIRRYTDRGILTHDVIDSKPVRPTSAPTAAEPKYVTRLPARTVLVNFPRFLLACRHADLALRRTPLESIVRNVATRARARPSSVTSASLMKTIRLAATFDSLRLLYPKSYLCIFDSLALLEFLAYHSLYPRWIFGVRAEPFQAHCWVQYDGVLLNDKTARTSSFTPIMTV